MKSILFFVALFISSITHADILLKNANIFTASEKGILENYDLLISNGKIKELRRNITSSDITTFDLKGKFISPGIIAPASQLGTVEIELVPETRDDRTDIYSAGFNIDDAFNPSSTLIPHNRSSGVTLSITTPSSSGLFKGLSSAFNTSGSLTNSLVSSEIALTVDISGGSDSRAANILLLKDVIQAAENFTLNNLEDIEAMLPHEIHFSARDFDAIKRMANNEIPLIVKADRASDILTLIKIQKNLDISLIIMGAREGWRVAKILAKSKIPVIIQPIDNIPSSFNSLGSRLDNAAILHKAGVKILIGSDEWSSHNAYLSRQGAGIAVAYGLPWEEALKAITFNVADTFKLSDKGQVTEGMHADLVVWDGDPLEVTSFAELVFIQGEIHQITSRSARLMERYRDLN